MLLELLSPERIQAFGYVATGLLTVWVGRQATKVKRLQAEVDELKGKYEEQRTLFATAVRFIRELLWHVRMQDLALRQHAPDAPVPDAPEIPAELKKEV
ncbi:hypothetical protein AAI421_13355 [Rhodococcus aetherivorans]|uniref:hypothetical protein n=1 Tax=Rhodococcus TaxID=1827 RepID=UPI0031D7324E